MPEQEIPILREMIEVTAGGAVYSVNGQTGDVVLTAEDVGAATTSEVTSTVNSAVLVETQARVGADSNLQGQIDALAAASDVTDIVGTYADLEAYDTTHLKDNDIIKVLQDETHDGETAYYRWSTSTETFTLIGEEGPYYTKAAADSKFQDKLTAGSNITIDANNEISATDTTYSNFTGTDGIDPGTSGLVPAPAVGDENKVLKGDGTWGTASGSIPTDATFWGASYDESYNTVSGPIILYDGGWDAVNAQISQTYGGRININIPSNKYISMTVEGTRKFAIRADQERITSSYVLNMQTHRIERVDDPTDAQDAATKNYVDTKAIGTTESSIIGSSDWTPLAGASPYTYSMNITASYTIGADTIVELINDDAINFATYGFAIGAINNQNVTIYSIGAPSSSVTLKINYKG